MKKNNLKIFNTLLILQLFAIVNIANAQWEKPSSFGLANDMDQMAENLINWLLGFAAIFSVLALIWGGINYIGSSGDAQKSELAKKIIYYALIGLIVTGLAFAIVRLLVAVIFN
ncbi:MAG: hypothetical protein KAS01_01345 [Candidatus Pacebacteria bacterium]|nr:hypothetical protein [Candidatus Paceibacterota bacterium]